MIERVFLVEEEEGEESEKHVSFNSSCDVASLLYNLLLRANDTMNPNLRRVELVAASLL